MNNRQIQTINALPENDFSFSRAYSKIYGVRMSSAKPRACDQLKKPEIRRAVVEFLSGIDKTTLSTLNRVKADNLLNSILQRELANV